MKLGVTHGGRGGSGWAFAVAALLAACSPSRPATLPRVAETPRLTRAAGADYSLEREAMQSDLDFWLTTLQAVHPAPFTKIPREEFLKAFDAAKAGLPARLDPLEFFAVVQRLAATLHDSHTRAHFPAHSRATRDAWWPVPVVVRDGDLLVSKAQSQLSRGTRLRRINGVWAGLLLRDAVDLTNSERPEAAQLEAASALGVALWLRGMRSPFRVEGVLPDGKPIQATVSGVLPRDLPEDEDESGPDFRLSWVDSDVAVLTLAAMSDVDGFAQFIEGATRELGEKHARGLIVDLRHNRGGSTEVAELLINRISSKPYRIASEKYWRVSEQYKKLTEDEEYRAKRPGIALHYKIEPTTPGEVAHRYAGPTCFLIGPNSVSAAMMLANAVKDYGLATLFGEPTASPPNYFGEVYGFELPRSHLPVQSSVAYFVRANGDANDPNPVEPDFLVAPTLEQWLRGEDPVLERARAWIGAQTTRN